MISKSTLLVAVLALIMLFPCYIAFGGLWHFLTSDSPNRVEGLMGVGYMAMYSLAIAAPYLISVLVLRKNIAKKALVLTALPFIVMLFFTIYGTYLGIPW